MKFILIVAALFFSINVLIIEGKYWDYSDNGENSIVIERKNSKKEKCESYSIYKDDILIKSNIPIVNGKINLGDININQSRLTLKCDNLVKQKREENEIKDLSELESDEEDDSIIDAIDNVFIPSDKASDKEEEYTESANTLSKSTIPINKSNNKCKSNKKGKSLNGEEDDVIINNKDIDNEQHNDNGSQVSSQDNSDKSIANDYNNEDNEPSSEKHGDNNNNSMKIDEDKNINGDEDKDINGDESKDINGGENKDINGDENKDINGDENKDINGDEDKDINGNEDTDDSKNAEITTDQNIDNNNNNDNGIDKEEDKNNNDKPEDEIVEDKEDRIINKVHLSVGLSLSFLLTGGMLLSVLKFRKMSYRQLEYNAQEMSANSVYIPSPMISNAPSILSMSTLDIGSNSRLFENSIGSSSNSFIV